MNWIPEIFCKLSASDWAAWIQAIGVFFAIYCASSAASTQSENQYKNSIRLKAIEDFERRLMLTESVAEIFKNTSERIKHIQNELPDAVAIYDVSTKRKYYDLDCLTDLLAAFKQIPLHDLPSAKLVTAVMISIATVRQLDIQIDKSFREARAMDGEDFEKVLTTIKQVNESMQLTCKDVTDYYASLQSQRPTA
jgi:hypothetical protein